VARGSGWSGWVDPWGERSGGGGFTHPDDSDARFLHHLDIFVEAVIGHVFRVICDAVENGFHFVGGKIGFTRAVLSRRLGRSVYRNYRKDKNHQANNKLAMRVSWHVLPLYFLKAL